MREANLLSYLPPIIRNVRELKAVTDAENPEFELVFGTSEQVLKNQFIHDCDANGIARYEKILGIKPTSDDTLESRVFRVLSRWNDKIPYTWKAFLERLDALCGKGNYTISLENWIYTINLKTHMGVYGGLQEIYNLLDEIIPCNMIVNLSNDLIHENETNVFIGNALICGSHYVLTENIDVEYSISSNSNTGSVVVDGTHYILKSL